MNKLAAIAVNLLLVVATATTSCSGGGYGSDSQSPQSPAPVPAAPSVTIDVGIKQLIFSWADVSGATHYRLLENADGDSGFTRVGANIPAGTLFVSLNIAVHFHDFANALYIVEACNTTGCNGSTEVNAMNGMLDAIGYFKASNTDERDSFGSAIALSGDGNTLAVGAPEEDSGAVGINGDQNVNSASSAGAVYVFQFDGTDWSQQAYVKASDTDQNDRFGTSVALNVDGNTLAVGAPGAGSTLSGAVYVFRFDGSNWSQQSLVTASSIGPISTFGHDVALSADGNTFVATAPHQFIYETAELVRGTLAGGAVYVFRFDGANWVQEAGITPTDIGHTDRFGWAVALDSDGTTFAAGVNTQEDMIPSSASAYIYRFDGTEWSQQVHIKGTENGGGDLFGSDVALSADGNTLAVGSENTQFSFARTVALTADGNILVGRAHIFRFDGTAWALQADNIPPVTRGASGGMRFVFRFDGTAWAQVANVAGEPLSFGDHVALSADGSTLAIGAYVEDSSATGINGDRNDNSAEDAGAVYLY